ncbi:MAG: hypothetical protein LBU61_06930 [Coriobacteriales bacterium]|nr:hypothetical protein [Coriobacteriales bacterium]
MRWHQATVSVRECGVEDQVSRGEPDGNQQQTVPTRAGGFAGQQPIGN